MYEIGRGTRAGASALLFQKKKHITAKRIHIHTNRRPTQTQHETKDNGLGIDVITVRTIPCQSRITMELEQKKIKSEGSSADEERGLERIGPFDTSEAAAAAGDDNDDDASGETKTDNTPVYNAKEMFQQVSISLI